MEPMTVDQALVTTRAVRKRLDLTRPVPREVINECLRLALQAPNGSNRQLWHFVVVEDAATRAEMARIYNDAIETYRPGLGLPPVDWTTPSNQRMGDSVAYLREHLHEVPVLVVPAVTGRLDGASIPDQAHLWGSILPAAWSLMLALRARGLGSVWTTVHLAQEQRMAELLGIPYAEVTQAGLFPVAYTIGTDFKPGTRELSTDVVHFDRW